MKLDSRRAATTWEFENRALFLGVLFSVAFMWSAFDPQNVTVALAHALSDPLQADGDRLARTLFALAAVVVSTCCPEPHMGVRVPQVGCCLRERAQNGCARRRRSIPSYPQSAVSRQRADGGDVVHRRIWAAAAFRSLSVD
jgi:hypothetical protein